MKYWAASTRPPAPVTVPLAVPSTKTSSTAGNTNVKKAARGVRRSARTPARIQTPTSRRSERLSSVITRELRS